MTWWQSLTRWMRAYQEVGQLRSEVAYYRRMAVEASRQRDEAIAAAEGFREVCAQWAQAVGYRDAEIKRLAVLLDARIVTDAPLGRYKSAVRAELLMRTLIEPVEALKVGIYRSKDGSVIQATYRALSEAESDGWELLDADEAVKELRQRARMAMGVWN